MARWRLIIVILPIMAIACARANLCAKRTYVLSGEKGQSVSSEMVIQELAVRWMVCFLEVNGYLIDKTYYLELGEGPRESRDPSEELLRHLSNLGVAIKPISEYTPRHVRREGGPLLVVPGPCLSVETYGWSSDTRARVNCSAHTVSGWLMQAPVVWKKGKWALVEPISVGHFN